MAQDDMHVVMYKILAYLYSCMKDGNSPKLAGYSAETLGIPQLYWAFIMEELVNHGFVSGVNISRDMGGHVFVNPVDPKVTMEGVEFAQENTAMAKAKKFLMDAKSFIPFV